MVTKQKRLRAWELGRIVWKQSVKNESLISKITILTIPQKKKRDNSNKIIYTCTQELSTFSRNYD